MAPRPLVHAIAVVVLACSLHPALAGDDATTAERVAVVTGSDVNVRAGPSVNFHDVGKLQKDDLVVVRGEEGDWSRLHVPGGMPVFVHGTLVDWEEGSLRGVVNGSNVLMRPTAGQAYAAVSGQRLQAGDEVLVLGLADGADGPWLRVLPPDTVHVWVHSRYVRKLAPMPELDRRLARAAQIRIDTLTGGRMSAERRARERRERDAYAAELSKLREILRGGSVGAEHVRAASQLLERAPSGDLRREAVALTRDLGRALDARDTPGPPPTPPASGEERAEGEQRTDEEERGRREAEARERAEAERIERERREAEARQEAKDAEKSRDAERSREGARGAPTAKGEVERDGMHLVMRVGSVTYRLRSRRYRLTDFAGRLVRVWGTRSGSSDVLNVDFLELVSGP